MPPERAAQSYGPGVTGASKAVLLELMTALRAYRDALVLVGGWVPSLLLQQHQRPEDRFVHVGSIDIDLAVDATKVHEPEYATILELLQERGYRPAADQRGRPLPSSVLRVVSSPATAKPYAIRVDFLIPHTDPRPGRHVPVQDDLLARKIRGCEAAFTHQTTVSLTGTLPEGGELSVPMRMADLVGILTMKGIVLGERYREKDAYDIYALLAHYRRGPRDVAEALKPFLSELLVGEALASIRTAFGSRKAHGPAWVAAFLVNPVFIAERERLITDAFMVVEEFHRLLAAEPLRDRSAVR